MSKSCCFLKGRVVGFLCLCHGDLKPKQPIQVTFGSSSLLYFVVVSVALNIYWNTFPSSWSTLSWCFCPRFVISFWYFCQSCSFNFESHLIPTRLCFTWKQYCLFFLLDTNGENTDESFRPCISFIVSPLSRWDSLPACFTSCLRSSTVFSPFCSALSCHRADADGLRQSNAAGHTQCARWRLVNQLMARGDVSQLRQC